MSLFCLNHSFVYFWDRRKISKQGCSSTRKGDGNGVNDDRPLVKIESPPERIGCIISPRGQISETDWVQGPRIKDARNKEPKVIF